MPIGNRLIVGEAELTAQPEEDALRLAETNQTKSKDARRMQLGRGPKRGAQRVSAHEPTDDFVVEAGAGGVELSATIQMDDDEEEAHEQERAKDETSTLKDRLPAAEPSSMSVSQLKAELRARGIDTSDALEKAELVKRLREDRFKNKVIV